MLTPPVFLVLLSLQAAIGALVASCFQPPALLCIPSVLGPLLGLLLLTEDERDCVPVLNSRPAILLCVFLFLLPAFAFTYTNMRIPHEATLDLARFADRHVCIEASVVSVLPIRNGKNARFICAAKSAAVKKRGQSHDEACEGKTILFIRKGSPWIEKINRHSRFRFGAKVASVASLERNRKNGYANFLKRLGITSLCYLDSDRQIYFLSEEDHPLHTKIGESFCDFIDAQRNRLISFHVGNLGAETGTLLASMVLGERAVGVSQDLLSSFRTVGLSHLLAASGFNLTIVTLSTHWACRVLGLSALPGNFLTFAMMAVFVSFAGGSSSVVRASLMCALAIACSCLGRRAHIAGLLGAALLISIFIDPLSVADPGFQLSYSAVSGLIFIVAPISEHLKKTVSRRWLRFFIDCLVTVFVAQACVLPLQLFYFKQIGLLFLPANLLASLIVAPVTVAGFASSLIVLVCPSGNYIAAPVLLLASVLDWMAALPLKLLLLCVAELSSCRWAVLQCPQIGAGLVFLYYLTFVSLSIRLLQILSGIVPQSGQSSVAEHSQRRS